jgi:ATP-dependent RNA helicase DeaD
MTDFLHFGLEPALLRAIQELGFEKPTPVQSKVLPLLMKGARDVVALAQTGTGKTAAYGLPLVQLTDPADPATQALILCPTRELCLQITKDLSGFAKFIPEIRILAVYGGASIGEQIRVLKRGAHIIVATPGRMNDLLRRKSAKLDSVARIVLDEADEMLNMGFQEDVETILKAMPDTVRKLMFSATMPRQVASIAGKYMHEPEEITIGQRNSGSENISHEYYMVHAKDRYLALKRIVDFNRNMYAIIFCRTRVDTQEVAAKLMADGYPADALHGDLTQDQRDRVMKKFRNRAIHLLVATDVAARGLDVTDLTHVINYELPDEARGYTHRSGRTGRAGKEGVSIVIINLREEYKIGYIERLIKQKFVHKQLPSGQEVCASQLKGLIERLQQVDLRDSAIKPFMPIVAEALAAMPPEEVVKRCILLEFNRFLSYYKDAPDLNQGQRPAGGPERSRTRTDHTMVKLEINLGARNGLTPAELIGVINRATPGPQLRIGRIQITEHVSQFEVAGETARDLAHALSRASYNNRKISARLAEGRP